MLDVRVYRHRSMEYMEYVSVELFYVQRACTEQVRGAIIQVRTSQPVDLNQ